MHDVHIRPVVGERLSTIQANDIVPGPGADALPFGAGTRVAADRRGVRFRGVPVRAGDSQDLEQLLKHKSTDTDAWLQTISEFRFPISDF